MDPPGRSTQGAPLASCQRHLGRQKPEATLQPLRDFLASLKGSELWAPVLKVVCNISLQWVSKDSELAAHTGGPWNLLRTITEREARPAGSWDLVTMLILEGPMAQTWRD